MILLTPMGLTTEQLEKKGVPKRNPTCAVPLCEGKEYCLLHTIIAEATTGVDLEATKEKLIACPNSNQVPVQQPLDVESLFQQMGGTSQDFQRYDSDKPLFQ